MSDLLIRGAEAVMTGLPGAQARAGAVDLRIRDGVIHEMAAGLIPAADERVIEARGCVVYPGWVNTHHHLFQSLLKAVPEGINEPLFGWLGAVPYPRLTRIRDRHLETAAMVGLAELLLSGTSTCADHHYIYYAGLDSEMGDVLFEVADRLGLRFVLCRGGATEKGRHPGYPNNLESESVDDIINDVQRLRERYHQVGTNPMRQVVMAPTTPTFSVNPAVLRELARAARSMGVRLHSHLSETRDYVTYCREVHGMTPVQFCAENEWLGDDVWFAHMVHVADEELPLLLQTGTGIAHCPQSNCRLGSGIARAPEMSRLGIPVSLAVDGAASNEAADMIQEAHLAWMVHRAHGGADAVTAEEVIEWGTRGGARVLGLDGIGTLSVGSAADLAIYDLDQPRYFGAHDVAVAPVCAGGTASLRYLLVNGKPVVENGAIPGLDMEALREQAARATAELH
ncbi:amidohydrolase [Alcanivorax balearicus MACL04]|uniref:Amidohydrolase n=1 Tax=Alloalcanivorax balearicus MACL04 TaxID=1177182 RepID=A0ABT2QW48_9GAMM|nr:amidohydrolase family protein [Alloalcanivorax balearicus]MCU5781733.1 amidohydrolase [Alloalcanivorax balearicus MACL04]